MQEIEAEMLKFSAYFFASIRLRENCARSRRIAQKKE